MTTEPIVSTLGLDPDGSYIAARRVQVRDGNFAAMRLQIDDVELPVPLTDRHARLLIRCDPGEYQVRVSTWLGRSKEIRCAVKRGRTTYLPFSINPDLGPMAYLRRARSGNAVVFGERRRERSRDFQFPVEEAERGRNWIRDAVTVAGLAFTGYLGWEAIQDGSVPRYLLWVVLFVLLGFLLVRSVVVRASDAVATHDLR